MPSSRIRCSSEIMQATCQEKIAVLSRESWLRSLCVIVIIPIDPIWYFSWGLPQNWSCLLWTMLNARKHLAPHTVHHPHDLLYIDQHRSSSLPESKKSHWWGKGEVGGKTPWNQMRKLRFWSGTLLAQKVVMSVTVQFAQFSSPFPSR